MTTAPALPFWPRLLSRERAAAYCGVGLSTFDALVTEKRLPAAQKFPGVRRALWDRNRLDAAVDRMSPDPTTTEPADDDIEGLEAAWQKQRKDRAEKARRRHREGLPVRPGREKAA